jgi:hypothetical protein
VSAHPVQHYEIRVNGRLSPRWSAWFDGMGITTDADGTTVISGPVVDQSALHGLIQKLRDAAIPLVSITPTNPDSSISSTERH